MRALTLMCALVITYFTARPPYRLVTCSARTEATFVGAQREHCPVMATVRSQRYSHSRTVR
ncbi:hypothetical protein [Nonomuraea sp. NPDC050310]|uniref:hypothetical protein n=1 Tax=Nonomuraea sp. NPDC050310 TaxID=3154935 RepID=UPI0033CEDE20